MAGARQDYVLRRGRPMLRQLPPKSRFRWTRSFVCCLRSRSARDSCVELIASLPFALARQLSRPGAHWGSQYQVGAAIFLSASKAREKTRSHREHGIFPDSSFLVGSSKIHWPHLPHVGNAEDIRSIKAWRIGGDIIKRMVCVTRDPQPV